MNGRADGARRDARPAPLHRTISLCVIAALGTVLGVVGVIIWFYNKMAATTLCEGPDTVTAGVRDGFRLMVLGPLVGWIAIPVGVVWGRQRKWLSWPILAACALLAALTMTTSTTPQLCRPL